MDASISLLTLGVRDLAVARQFYVDGLGWAPAFEVADDVCFIKVGAGLLLGLWSRDALAAEAGGLLSVTRPRRSRWRTWFLMPSRLPASWQMPSPQVPR